MSRALKRHAILGLALITSLSMLAPLSAQATTTAAVGSVSAQAASGFVPGARPAAQQSDPSDRPPLDPNNQALRSELHEPALTPHQPLPALSEQPVDGPNLQARAAACSPSEFTELSGAELVAKVTSSTVACLTTFYYLAGSDAQAIFAQSQMITIANALKESAATYAGASGNGTDKLILFLRAGYYVQWGDPDGVGEYGPELQTAVGSALEVFFSNERSTDVTEANGNVLSEAVILIDSAQVNGQFIHVVEALLNGYDESWNPLWGMMSALNSTFTVLYNGHSRDGFVEAAVASDTLLDTLYSFASTNLGLVGSDKSYLVVNASRELARFVQYDELKAEVKPLVQALLSETSLDDNTAPLWVGLAEMTNWYDEGHCEEYGTCNLAERVKAAILTINYTCSDSITILAQSISDADLAESCASLNGQDEYFHSVVKDAGPVADDVNERLEVIVYHSSSDYQSYAGATFDIDTDNGGMYLEGDPSVSGNMPQFIAYEAEWVRPAFQIWNLNHEYTHYLDGRFNMHGDFEDNITTPTIWWVEGFAEYVSYTYRGEVYEAALDAASSQTYTLSELFDTTYENSDSARIYNWGYLAARFMLNEHPTEMTTVLEYYRAGDYEGARSYLTGSIGTSYDQEFRDFLALCGAGDCGDESQANIAPMPKFSSDVDGLTVAFTDESTDADGTIESRAWDFGDGTTSEEANPSKSYSTAGSYEVTLTITDDGGRTASASENVTVEDESVPTTPTNAAPTAKFSTVLDGLTATFTDGSTDVDGTIESRTWDFGDGTTSEEANPSKSYSTAGSYNVTLTVTDNDGATASVTATVAVSESAPPTKPGAGDAGPGMDLASTGFIGGGASIAALMLLLLGSALGVVTARRRRAQQI